MRDAWYLAAASVLVTVACASSAPPPARADMAPAASGSALDAAVPVASTPAAPAPLPPPPVDPATLPLPPAPPGTDPEMAMFAASICAASYLDKDVGCRSHPPFVRPDQKPDGKFVEHQGDPLLFCAIDKIFHGSFTKAGAKQAVVSFTQCKESAEAMWDAGFPGSAVLTEEIDGRWRAIGYEPDVNVGGCRQVHRRDGRDVLVCQGGLAAPPSGVVTFFFAVDFAHAGPKGNHATSFAKVFGDMPSCGLADTGLPDGLIYLKIIRAKFADTNHDGTDDLAVTVERAQRPASPALDAKLRAACKGAPGMLDARALLPPPRRSTLQFTSDGERFVPTAATRKLLDKWAKEGPESFNGLLGAGPPLAE